MAILVPFGVVTDNNNDDASHSNNSTSESEVSNDLTEKEKLLAASVASENCQSGSHCPELQATFVYLGNIARTKIFKISKWQKKEDFEKGGRFYNIAADMLDYRRTGQMERFDRLWSAKSGFADFVQKKLGDKRSSVDESLRNTLGGRWLCLVFVFAFENKEFARLNSLLPFFLCLIF